MKPFKTKYDLARMTYLYEKGVPIADIAKDVGLPHVSQVRATLRRAGVPLRSTPRPTANYRQYTMDEGYFARIDTERKAYWLGFIIADGNVHLNRLTIGVQVQDIGHLEQFLEDVGSNSPVVRGKTSGYSDKEQCRVRLNSQQLISDLGKLGVVPRKSGREVAPLGSIPDNLHRHFWRGVVDGDGWVTDPHGTKREGRALTPKVGLVGSERLCGQFREWVGTIGRVSTSVAKRSHCKGLYSFVCNRRDLVHPLLQELYADCEVALERKEDRAKAWGFSFSPVVHRGAPKITEENVREMRKLFLEGYTNAQLTEMFSLGRNVANGVTSGRSYSWVK